MGEELLCVLENGFRIMNAAWTHHDDEAVVSSVDGVRDRIPGVRDTPSNIIGEGHLLVKNRRGDHGAGVGDSEVVGEAHGGAAQTSSFARRLDYIRFEPAGLFE